MADLDPSCPGPGFGLPVSTPSVSGTLPGVDVGPPPGMLPTLPAIALCLFPKLDYTKFLSFKLPPIPLVPTLPPFLADPKFWISFDCKCDNPLNATAGLPSGGGRAGYSPYNPDNDYD